jgi:hypothetical protein
VTRKDNDESPSLMKSDVAVAVTTVCRETLLRAVRSVYWQDFTGTVHLLIGIDVDLQGDKARLLQTIEAERPKNVLLTVVDLGYSTSQRHGGVHRCHFGGSLRTILTFAANSEWVAYLDDDDWYLPEHLRLCVEAARGKKWAFSLCWYADSDRSQRLCIDEIESVGPGKGGFAAKFGGFVRPSALIVNKLELPQIHHLWSQSPTAKGDGEDRLVFAELRKIPEYGQTQAATVCYSLDPKDSNHDRRCEFIRSRGVDVAIQAKAGSVRT